MQEKDTWYVRNSEGKIFGPASINTLKQWVNDGRVEPISGVSQDLQNWRLAPEYPELEMNWVVENTPGQFYGPTARKVLDDLMQDGTLSPEARIYCNDHGAAQEKIASLTAACEEAAQRAHVAEEKVANTLQSYEKVRGELGKVQDELKNARVAAQEEVQHLKEQITQVTQKLEDTQAEFQKAHALLQNTQGALQTKEAEIAKLEAELEKAQRELTRKKEVPPREWKTPEVLTPEIVCSEPPPSSVRKVFAPEVVEVVEKKKPRVSAEPFNGLSTGTLADLEKQAQRELAKIGAHKFPW